jgi:predicted P-loop ATPase
MENKKKERRDSLPANPPKNKSHKIQPMNGKGTSNKATNSFQQVENYLSENFNLRYNVVSHEVEYKKKIDPDYKILNESTIYRELKKGDFKISMADLNSLLASDFVEEYDPFIFYFNSLPLPENGIDYISKLASYVKTNDPIRFTHHLKKHLVRTIACAINPKFFNKHAFILVGYTQDSGKSTFCRFLCPPNLSNYITETFSTTDKDALIALSENLIINLDELATLDKQDINKLKSFFSKDNVKARHPFERKTKTTPRRASFMGSTNEQEFLSDETGSVRWLCFEVESINWNYSKDIDIDKVWSQAYQLYINASFDYKLTREEIKENERSNQRFQKGSPEKDLVQKFFTQASENDYELFLTATEILQDISLNVGTIKLNHNKIGKALVSLGYKRCSVRIPEKFDYPVYGYYVKKNFHNL